MTRSPRTCAPLMTDATEAEVRAINRAAYLRLAERLPKPPAVVRALGDARSSAQWLAPETALPWPTREEWAARPATYADGTAAWLDYLRHDARSLPLRPYAPEPRR